MAWKSPNNWFRNWLINKWSFEGMRQRFKDNFSDGYRFGDVFKSLFGVSKYDENLKPIYKEASSVLPGDPNATVNAAEAATGSVSDVASDVGSTMNDLTGVSQSQAFQDEQRQKSEAFTHQENLLSREWQEYMSNSAIQRQMADARAAGVNPYYLFGAGSASGAGNFTASGSTNSTGAPGSGNSGVAVAALVAGLVKLIAMM